MQERNFASLAGQRVSPVQMRRNAEISRTPYAARKFMGSLDAFWARNGNPKPTVVVCSPGFSRRDCNPPIRFAASNCFRLKAGLHTGRFIGRAAW